MTFSNCAMKIFLKWPFQKKIWLWWVNPSGNVTVKNVPFPVSDSGSKSDSLIVYLHFWTYSTQFYGFSSISLYQLKKLKSIDEPINSLYQKNLKNPQNDHKFIFSETVLFLYSTCQSGLL